LNIRDLKRYLRRKEIITVIVTVVIVICAAVLVSQIWQPRSEEEGLSLETIQYKIEPEEFEVTENGTLFLEIMNKMNSTVRCDYYFETHNNVELYLGANLLQKSNNNSNNNYTHTKSLDATERSHLEFIVVASLDVGDDSRKYYIMVYIFADNAFVSASDVDFWVKRGD